MPPKEPMIDLDEVTGKPAPPPPPAKEPFLANPLKLGATGSGSGHVSRADFARAGVALVSVYGMLQMAQPLIVQFLTAPGPDGNPMVPHGENLADAFSACMAAAVAIYHLACSYARDNRPREEPGPPAPAPDHARVP